MADISNNKSHGYNLYLDNVINMPSDEKGSQYEKNKTFGLLESKSAVAPVPSKTIMRKWKTLTRLQRSVVYILVLGSCCTLLLYFAKNEQAVPSVDKHSEDQNVPRSATDQHITAGLINIPGSKEVELEKPIFSGPKNARQFAVVEAFKHAWRGYKEHAWGHDNLKPVSGMPYDWFSLGLTIVDALDTAFIMGLTEEYQEGKKWVEEDLIFTKNKDVNLFEVTIRILGALLTNYHFTGDRMFLRKAEDLGDRLMAAFSSPSGIPYSDVNLATKTAHAPEWSHYSTTAEVTTIQLEFRELSRASNNPVFEDAAASVSEKIHQLPKKHGLVPIFINPISGQFLPHATITLGARGDSYYEYLLKQWLQTGKTVQYFLDDYLSAIEGVREFLAKRSSPKKLLFIGELSAGSEMFNPKMDHLTCFLPGTLALGHANGLPEWHLKMAEELLYTCYLTYAAHPTFLAPEITHFNLASATEDLYTKAADSHSLLRPEFVESLYYMYQLTGNSTYQDWGWQIFQSFEKYAKVSNGYSSLGSVKKESPNHRDMMESFFLSETLKYLYLLLSNDRFELDLSKYVLNTEAHPLPIRDH